MGQAPWRFGPSTRRARRALGVASVVSLIAAVTVVTDACVIADPPTELPRTSERRPTIKRASVVPSTTAVLGRWPAKFTVPVELSDPFADVTWATFVDYNSVTGEGLIQYATSRYTPASTSDNIRMLEIPIVEPSSDRCHIVEIIVALHLNTNDTRNVHTPEPPGGDSVSWFFSPSGDLAGCPVLDAGLYELVDSGSDAEVEAGGGQQ